MSYLKETKFLLLVFLAACFPKEEAVEPIPRVNQSVEVDAGEFKNDVVFYSLDEQKIVAKSSPMAWDFYIDEDVIRLNYFRSMRVAEFNDDWYKLEDTAGLDFRYLTFDMYDGLTQWQLKENQIYVVDYGMDNDYKPMGLMSVRFERVAEGIHIWYNAIGSDYEVYEIVTEPSFYYNLREKATLDLPTEDEYDVAFGKYTDLVTFGDVTQEYLIYGALQGRSLVYREVAPFDSVLNENFDVIRLSSAKNVIGWDWKAFNLDKNAYEITENYTYLISSNAGFKYKLRFVSFYNRKGVSGHPTFEWKLL